MRYWYGNRQCVGELPAAFLNARKEAFVGEFAETDAAHIEVAHKTTAAATAEAAIGSPCRKLGLLLRTGDD